MVDTAGVESPPPDPQPDAATAKSAVSTRAGVRVRESGKVRVGMSFAWARARPALDEKLRDFRKRIVEEMRRPPRKM